MIRSPQHVWLAALCPVTALCLITAVCLITAGCGADTVDPVLTFTSVDAWRVPAAGQFLPAPRALYSDENDTVYALDEAGRVLVYNADGRLERMWDMPESAAGRPEGIWRLRDGRIAVADTHYHRVVIFEADGTVSHMFGSRGRNPGEFVFPVAITEDPLGFLYVGEYGDWQRIQKFTADGTFVTQFGRHGTRPGEFQRPSAIVWRDGTVYAVDAFNNRIQTFTDDGRFTGVIVPRAPSPALEFPYDLKITPEGNLVVIENKAGRLTIMNPDGRILGRFGHPSRGQDGFLTPWAVTVLTDGRILVADTGNHQLVELTP